jgi:hypothetical protein
MNMEIKTETLQAQNIRVTRAGYWTHVMDLKTGEGEWVWNGKFTAAHKVSTIHPQILHKDKPKYMNGLG